MNEECLREQRMVNSIWLSCFKWDAPTHHNLMEWNLCQWKRSKNKQFFDQLNAIRHFQLIFSLFLYSVLPLLPMNPIYSIQEVVGNGIASLWWMLGRRQKERNQTKKKEILNLMRLTVDGHQINVIRFGLRIEISHRSLTLVSPYQVQRVAFYEEKIT